VRISEKGLNHLKKSEGWRNSPYYDSAGVATIGYGFTFYPNNQPVKMTDSPITLTQGENMLKLIIRPFEKWVTKLVTSPLSQHQFDALVSFCYNVGQGNFGESTLLKKVNINPNGNTIQDEFKRWVYAGGKKSKGLKKRRNKEAYLYENGY